MENSNLPNEGAGLQAQIAPETPPVVVDHPVGELSTAMPHLEGGEKGPDAAYQQYHETPLSNFLERLTPVGTAAVTGAVAPETIVATFNPWKKFLDDAFIADKVKNFSYIRGDLEVTVMAVFPSGCYGRFQVVGFPMRGTLADTLRPLNCRQMDSSVPIDASAGAVVRMTLPWTYWYDYALITSQDMASFWSLNIVALTSLQTAIPGGSTSGYFRVFARLLPGWDMVVPRLQTKHREKLGSLARDMEKRTAHLSNNGPVSSVAAKVKGAASMLSGIPFVGQAATMVADASSVVGSIASFFGYTREVQSVLPKPILVRSLNNVATTDSKDIGEKVVLAGEGLLASDPTLQSNMAEEDILAFPSLFKRPTLIGRYTITPSTPVDTNVFVIPVTPSYYRNLGVDNEHCLSVMGYLGLPFDKWRGDLVYHVEIVGATMHGGSVQVVWYPYTSTFAGNPSNVLNNSIIDLSDTVEHQFEIGFAREVPFLANHLWRNDLTIEPQATSNGYIVMKVLAPMQSQDPSNSATVLVWVSARENLEFRRGRGRVGFPAADGEEIVVVNQRLDMDLHLQTKERTSEALGAEGREQVVEHAMNGPSGTYPVDAINFPGQGTRSARALMQKPSRFINQDAYAVTAQQWFPMVDVSMWWPLGNTLYTRAQSFSFCSYYSAPFTFAAYSSHYQVATKDPAYITAAVGGQDMDASTAALFGSCQWVPSVLSAHFVVPYSFQTKFLPTAPVTWAETGQVIQTLAPYQTQTGVEAQYWRSAGEDIRVGRFAQVPILVINHENDIPYRYVFPRNPPIE